MHIRKAYILIRHFFNVKDDFFEESRVPLAKWLYFLYLWCQDTMVNKAAETTCIAERTTFQVYQYIRDIYTTKLLHTPTRLGGPGVIVQIDESLFCHKAKYCRGHRASKEQWVFGLADTSAKPAITYMQTVDKLDADTLLPIIQSVVQPRTIIHSDQWRVYYHIQEKLHLEHATVNHSVNFVDPDTGVYTQTIESCWARTKLKFKTMKDVSTDALPSYLDERMWRDRWGKTTEDTFNNLCAHIAEQYLVTAVLSPNVAKQSF